jgi:hypothetical protein
MARPLAALLITCCALAPAHAVAAPPAGAGSQQGVGVDLAADRKPSDRMPTQFRVTLVNASKRDLFESGPSFIVFIDGDEYAVARMENVAEAATKPIHLKPGEKHVVQVPVVTLEFRAPSGSPRPLSEVEARLARSHWSIVAIMGDVTDVDHSESSIRVQSNELVFAPHP